MRGLELEPTSHAPHHGHVLTCARFARSQVPDVTPARLVPVRLASAVLLEASGASPTAQATQAERAGRRGRTRAERVGGYVSERSEPVCVRAERAPPSRVVIASLRSRVPCNGVPLMCIISVGCRCRVSDTRYLLPGCLEYKSSDEREENITNRLPCQHSPRAPSNEITYHQTCEGAECIHSAYRTVEVQKI